jgi:predicted GNAT superfamily acetyltransferase
MTIEIRDLHTDRASRRALLDINNASASETSLMTPEKFDRMIVSARVATFIAPGAAMLVAFEQGDDYDGGHFLWFRSRFEQFIYIDRVVVATHQRRLDSGVCCIRIFSDEPSDWISLASSARLTRSRPIPPPTPSTTPLRVPSTWAPRRSTVAPKAYAIFSDAGLKSKAIGRSDVAPTFGTTRGYFSELFRDVNLVFSLAPMPFTTLMIAREMPAAIRPYSMAVAPVSSRKNFMSSRIEFPLSFQVPFWMRNAGFSRGIMSLAEPY